MHPGQKNGCNGSRREWHAWMMSERDFRGLLRWVKKGVGEDGAVMVVVVVVVLMLIFSH